MKRTAPITCEDCYFRRELLCALRLDAPCPTFRPASRHGLRPPLQAPLVLRPDAFDEVQSGLALAFGPVAGGSDGL